MIRRKLFSRVIKKHGARRVDRSKSCILSDVSKESVWESVLGDFIVKEFITEGFGDGTQC